jgi:hypothetical protein
LVHATKDPALSLELSMEVRAYRAKSAHRQVHKRGAQDLWQYLQVSSAPGQ